MSMITLPETNSLPLKIGKIPKRKRKSYSNHPFSGVFAVSFREGNSTNILEIPSGKRSAGWNDIPIFNIFNRIRTSTHSGAPIFQPAMLVDPGVYMSVEPKIGLPENFVGLFHGKSYEQMDDLGGFGRVLTPYFWFNTYPY